MPSLTLPRHSLSYGLVGVLVLVLFFLAFGEWGLIHYWRLSEEQTRLEERTRALQRENEVLREKIYRLGNDDRYLEKVVREELGLAREGEIVYRFPNLGSSDTEETVTPLAEFRPSSEQNVHP